MPDSSTSQSRKRSGRTRRESELLLVFEDDDQLYKSYMPYLNNGGLFVETRTLYPLGKRVLMLVRLPGGGEREPIPGEVAWVSPNEQGGKKRGIGVEFIDKAGVQMARRIENRLGTRLEGAEPTYTL